VRDTELQYHLISFLPEKVALQLKLLPVTNFASTVSKARELCLIYSRAATTKSVSQVHSNEDSQLEKMEESLQSLSEQLTALRDRSQTIRMLEFHKQSHAHSQHLQRWSLELCAYDFHVVYRLGKSNQCADSLSRLPVSLIRRETELTSQQIATTQEQDSLLSTVQKQLQTDPMSVPSSSEWKNFHYAGTKNYGDS